MSLEGLRESDAVEVERACGLEPTWALLKSFDASQPLCFTILADDTPCAMFGAAPDGDGGASVWFLATPSVHTIRPFTFLRHSREWVEWMSSLYYPLYNHVDAENTASIEWLKGCGFTLAADPIDLNGFPFYNFWR